MTDLLRLLPVSEPSEVLATLHRHLQLLEIVSPTPAGQPLMLWFGHDDVADPIAAFVSDGVVDLRYLLIDRALWPNPEVELLAGLTFATEAQWLAVPTDDPHTAADVAVILGIIAAVPWSDAVQAKMQHLAQHDEPGVRASVELAGQYAAALSR